MRALPLEDSSHPCQSLLFAANTHFGKGGLFICFLHCAGELSGACDNGETSLPPSKLVDVKSKGIVDPARVTKEAIQNSVSIAGTAITMGALVVDEPKDDAADAAAAAAAMGGGGMGMM